MVIGQIYFLFCELSIHILYLFFLFLVFFQVICICSLFWTQTFCSLWCWQYNLPVKDLALHFVYGFWSHTEMFHFSVVKDFQFLLMTCTSFVSRSLFLSWCHIDILLNFLPNVLKVRFSLSTRTYLVIL